MTNEKKPVGAPLGSRNKALKEGQEGATSFIHLRCKPSEKAAWVKAAEGAGGLSKWAIDALNDKAKT